LVNSLRPPKKTGIAAARSRARKRTALDAGKAARMAGPQAKGKPPAVSVLPKAAAKYFRVQAGKVVRAPKRISLGAVIRLAKTGSLQAIPNFKRPAFSTIKQRAARLEASLATGKSYEKANLTTADLAAPHRVPYATLRNSVLSESPASTAAKIGILCDASRYCEAAFRGAAAKNGKNSRDLTALADMYEKTRTDVEAAIQQHNTAKSTRDIIVAKATLIKAVNNLASNAPGLGPHETINARVSNRMHLHPTGDLQEPLTPRSAAGRLAYPNEPVAVTGVKGSLKNVISVTGAVHTLNDAAMPSQTVAIDPKVFRGALWVRRMGKTGAVQVPSSATAAPTGNAAKDWVASTG
jgi:hypothetical protein